LYLLKPPILPCPSTVSKAQIEICPKLKDFKGTLDNMESCEKLEHFYNATEDIVMANLQFAIDTENDLINFRNIIQHCLEKEMELHASIITCNSKSNNAFQAFITEEIHKLALSIKDLENIADPLILELYRGHRLNHLNIIKNISESNYNVTGSYIPINLEHLKNITNELKGDLAMSINHQLKEAKRTFNGTSFFGGVIFVTIVVLLSYFTLRCYKKKNYGSHKYH